MNAIIPLPHFTGDLDSATSVDEVLRFKIEAATLRAYAKEAADPSLEAYAVEWLMRAERKLGQLMAAQKAAGLMSEGGRPKETGRVERSPHWFELALDHEAGLQDGYAAKMFCGIRKFGPTLWPVIEALGLQMVLIQASAGTLKTPLEIKAIDKFAQERRKKISSLGGKARRAAMSDAEWASHCSKASRARWRKARMKQLRAGKAKCQRAKAPLPQRYP
jgi:hypothetical protein